MKDYYQKLFSASPIILRGLTILLEEKEIVYIIKNPIESARLGGFAEFSNHAEIHVKESQLEDASKILEEYKKSIDSEN